MSAGLARGFDGPGEAPRDGTGTGVLEPSPFEEPFTEATLSGWAARGDDIYLQAGKRAARFGDVLQASAEWHKTSGTKYCYLYCSLFNLQYQIHRTSHWKAATSSVKQ